MKHTARLLLFSAVLYPTTAHALYPLLDHIDILTRYNGTTNQWTWILNTDFEEANPAEAYLPAKDLEPSLGERNYRPEGSEWDFFGVAPGEPLWIYPENDSANAWLGFGDTQAGLKDPVKFSLVDVSGPVGGHFSMYRVLSGSPVVFMATADGIGAGDVYEKPQGHHHVSWAFSKKGMWAVRLKASATRTAGNAPTLGGPTDSTRLFFAIGEKAIWRASHFDAGTVMDDAVAGWGADPDRDGWVNLMEYAFGTNPNLPGFVNTVAGRPATPEVKRVTVGGVEYPAITFLRRKNPEQAELAYTVEWQSSLEAENWVAGGVAFETESLGNLWERVTVRDSVAAGTAPRFARVRVTGID